MCVTTLLLISATMLILLMAVYCIVLRVWDAWCLNHAHVNHFRSPEIEASMLLNCIFEGPDRLWLIKSSLSNWSSYLLTNGNVSLILLHRQYWLPVMKNVRKLKSDSILFYSQTIKTFSRHLPPCFWLSLILLTSCQMWHFQNLHDLLWGCGETSKI